MHEHVFALGDRMRRGLAEIADRAGVPAVVGGYGSLFVLCFMEGPLESYDDVLRNDDELFGRYRRELVARGIFEMPESLGRSHIGAASHGGRRRPVAGGRRGGAERRAGRARPDPMSIELAGAPVSWGVDFAGDPRNPRPTEVLDGIAAAGLEWMELGPPGFLPASAALLAERGLRCVGTFVFEDLHDPHARETVARAADEALAALATFGGRLLVLIDRPSPPRAATAGREHAAPRLDGPAWEQMVATIRRLAETADAAGVRAVVHHHAGGYVEFADEIDRLLADLPLDEAGLCLDTGHALYAGIAPERLVRDYADRLEHLHVKDLRPPVRGDFWSAVAAGVFCPAGDGLLDLARLAGALGDAGYGGFATIEQDRRPESPGTPEDDLRRSVARLRASGIG